MAIGEMIVFGAWSLFFCFFACDICCLLELLERRVLYSVLLLYYTVLLYSALAVLCCMVHGSATATSRVSINRVEYSGLDNLCTFLLE